MNWPCCEWEKERSEKINVIRRNLDDFMWKLSDLDSCENAEKYTVALFKKLGKCQDIDELANETIDMAANVQKLKLAQEEEEEKQEDWVFIKLLWDTEKPDTSMSDDIE